MSFQVGLKPEGNIHYLPATYIGQISPLSPGMEGPILPGFNTINILQRIYNHTMTAVDARLEEK